MEMKEKAAFLRGLMKGLEIDETTKEGKLLTALVDVVEDMARTITDLEEAFDDLNEAVDVIDGDLETLEEEFYGDYDDDCECDCCHDDDEEEAFSEDDEMYEVTCPSCNDTIYLDAGMLEEGEMHCPNCNESLEFQYDDEEDLKS